MNNPSREELERAIDVLEAIYPSEKEIKSGEYPQVADALDIAIDLLRAELARQDVTCDGCEHIKEKYAKHGGVTLCCNCSRGTILPDRYEPKGEKA